MIKIILTTLFLLTSLFAQNPKIYAALGDVIYNNAENIQKLRELDAYELYTKDIDSYISRVNKAKENGLALEINKASISKKEYLKELRELSKTNDYFQRSAKSHYKSSIKEEDNNLFSAMINSGFIDLERNKQEIIDYYFDHAEDINASGVIQGFLDEDAKLKAKREALAKRYKTKRMREEEKIKRIRENDKEEQERLERELQEQVSRKKVEIREHQRKELTK